LGRGETLDQPVEQRLGLGIDPVQVFKDQEQGLHLAFAQQHPLEPVERALAALRRVEIEKGAVVRHGVQERQQRREGLLERLVEGEHLAGHLGADGARVIAVVHLAVALQQVHDGDVGRRFAVGHRSALQHPPALGAVRVHTLVHQARLAHARFPHQGDDLAVARLRPCQGLVECLQLLLAAPRRA
jgi:hypothetical protein